MKTRNVILPAMAILFAAAGAFATNASKTAVAIQKVSIRDAVCVQNGVCDNTVIQTPCRYQNDESTLLDTFTPGDPNSCSSVAITGEWKAN